MAMQAGPLPMAMQAGGAGVSGQMGGSANAPTGQAQLPLFGAPPPTSLPMPLIPE